MDEGAQEADCEPVQTCASCLADLWVPPAEPSVDDDDDQPPSDWTKSKADWEWEQVCLCLAVQQKPMMLEFFPPPPSPVHCVHWTLVSLDLRDSGLTGSCAQAMRRRGERVALKIQNPATSKSPASGHKHPEVSVNSAFRGRASLAIPTMKATGDLGLLTAGAGAGGAGGHGGITPRGITPRGDAAGATGRHVGSIQAGGDAEAAGSGAGGALVERGKGSEGEARVCPASAAPSGDATGEGPLETQLVCPQCSGEYTGVGGELLLVCAAAYCCRTCHGALSLRAACFS
jgi:hypothetical protein